MRKHGGLISMTLGGLAAFGWLLSAALAAPAAGLEGSWQGTLDAGNGSVRVVLHFSESKGGSFTGTLDSPDQGAAGIEMDTVTFREPDLHFDIARIGSKYDGKMDKGDSGITGQWQQGGSSLSLSFKRVP
jgi:uncharacterized protein